MKSLNRNIVFLISLIIIAGGFYFLNQTRKTADKFTNVLLVGWDGTERDDFYKLLHDGKLPNVKKLIAKGSLINVDITSGATETKPGWAEILTGYSSQRLGVYSNENYRPIAKGYTIFERLKDHFGKENIVTVFIGGKFNHIGAKGPHRVCINCSVRDPKTFERFNIWDESAHYVTKPSEQRVFESREGEPYYYTKDTLDFYLVNLKEAPNVGKRALELLGQYENQRFFMFIHFEEPDEIGHRYGESSKEYSDAIIINDEWLGKIIEKLKKLNLYDKTLIYLTTDHGFDKGQRTHKHAPYVFLAANDPKVKKNGERLDITPTILDRYGINLGQFSPPLDGKSLASK